MDPSLEENLEDFLSQWKEAINRGENGSPLGKRDSGGYTDHLPGSSAEEDDVISPSPAKRPASFSFEPPPLLVLPGGWEHRDEPRNASATNHLTTSCDTRNENFVDTLIADLNEINTIPFFDVQLPREIALIIFKYLDMRDLCNCTMVSRSWSALADDDLLWYKQYLRIVPNDNLQPESRVHWKLIVQDLILQKKQIERNWKERICGLSDHQPDDSRVLCCATYSEGTILSCYSSGDVYIWDLSDEVGPTKVQQIPGPYLTSEPTCCDFQSSWAAIGTSDGCVKILDGDTCSQVYTLSELGCVDSVSISFLDSCLQVGVASHLNLNMVHPKVSVLVAGKENTWGKMDFPLENLSSQITRIKLSDSSRHTPCTLLYSTSSSLTLHSLHSPPVHILSSLDERGRSTCVSCFETDREMTTAGCGTSTFGYQVQLFDLPSGTLKSSLKGHGQPVTSLSMFPCSNGSHMVVSGSSDRRVRVFDSRCHTSFPVFTLRGHGGTVNCVQMDQWKVVSGSSDGFLIVWDQRMTAELWRTHERHSVQFCKFDDRYLVCGHVPFDKHPIRNVGRENPNICHRRLRGLVRVMDFSVDPLYYTRKLPSICSSNYDEPSASFFNLDLKLPYDTIS